MGNMSPVCICCQNLEILTSVLEKNTGAFPEIKLSTLKVGDLQVLTWQFMTSTVASCSGNIFILQGALVTVCPQ